MIGFFLILFGATAGMSLPDAEKFSLPNRMTVLLLPSTEEEDSSGSRIRVDFCFPGGLALDTIGGASLHCMEQMASPSNGPWDSIVPWEGDETCGVQWETDEIRLEASLVEMALRLAGKKPVAPLETESAPPRRGVRIDPDDFRFLSRDELAFRLFGQSPYARLGDIRRSPRREPESLPRSADSCLARIHPAQTLVLLRGADPARMRRIASRALENVAVDRPFSQSFRIVEDWPRLEARKEIAFVAADAVELVLAFPAPPRGSEDCRPFAVLVRELEERFGEGSVRVWSGLGSGLLWIRYKTDVARFERVSKHFRETMQEFSKEWTSQEASPHEFLRSRGASRDSVKEGSRAATRHFWGFGCEDWENPQADATELRASASLYLRRHAFFVLWPESKKDDWKGFP